MRMVGGECVVVSSEGSVRVGACIARLRVGGGISLENLMRLMNLWSVLNA